MRRALVENPSKEGLPLTVVTSSDYRGTIVLELAKGIEEETVRTMADLPRVAIMQREIPEY